MKYSSVIMLLLIVILLCQPAVFDAKATVKYEPEILDKKIIPINPTSVSDTEILVKVLDKFGRIQQAHIVYSTNNWKTNSTSQMEIVYGVPSNGTYSGRIPAQPPDVEVAFRAILQDDLGYTASYNDKYTSRNDRSPPNLSEPTLFPSKPGPEDDILVRVLAKDDESGIRNAILNFSTSNPDFPAFQTVEMTPNEDSLPDRQQVNYHSWIPHQPENTKVTYSVVAYDYSGKPSDIGKGSYVISKPEGKELLFAIQEITSVNVPYNMTAQISISGTLLTNSSFNLVSVKTTGYNERTLQIPLYNARVSQSGQKPVYEDLELAGRPWNFPFDTYSTKLSFSIPIHNASINLPNDLPVSEKVRQDWKIHIVSKKITSKENNTELALELEVSRSDAIFPIKLALVGSFYLLGAMFLIPQKDLSNRLFISLGVFALIFGLQGLVSRSTPFTYGIIPYSDLSISFLIFASIAYTVAAIILSYLDKSGYVYFYPTLVAFTIVFTIVTWPYSSNEIDAVQGVTALGLNYGGVIGLILNVALPRYREKRKSKTLSDAIK